MMRNDDVTGRFKTTHGLGRTATYRSWYTMLLRCNDPKHDAWRFYGGRGIKVCARWLDIENFVADMGMRPDGLTLDRIDGDGDYEPGNCRWASKDVQQLNRRHVKCSHQMAEEIRAAYKSGQTQGSIAAGCGLSQGLVSKIIRNVAWVRHEGAA